MKGKFRSYYKLDNATERAVWRTGLIVPDANVLLHFFRQNQQTLDQIYDVFSIVKDRLWIPYRVGKEFQQSRFKVISDRKSAYSTIKKKLDNCINRLAEELNQHRPHPVINIDELVAEMRGAFDTAERKLQKMSEKHPDEKAIDAALEKIDALFEDDRIGDKVSESELSKIYKEGKFRYERRIPPGFSDSKKPEPDCYSDLVIWKAILDRAKSADCPIIFITDDHKEDWWVIDSGERRGPRPELIEEFSEYTGQHFVMYGLNGFLKNARKYVAKALPEISVVSGEKSPSAADDEVLSRLLVKQNDIFQAMAGLRQGMKILTEDMNKTHKRTTHDTRKLHFEGLMHQFHTLQNHLYVIQERIKASEAALLRDSDLP